MGRPSKLSEAQKAEIIRRVSMGEEQTALADEFGVSKALVSKLVSKPAAERKQRVEAVANQLVTAESSLKALPVDEQADAQRLKDSLLSMSLHLGAAGTHGAAIAHRLSAIAATELQKVDDTEPLAGIPHLKAVSTLMNLAKEAAHIPLNLLAANKDRMKAMDDPPPDPGSVKGLTLEEATRAYQDLIG